MMGVLISEMADTAKEGLKVARFLMVLCSFAPLFVLWAWRGSRLIPDRYFVTGCVALAVLPNLFLLWRIITSKKLNEKGQLVIGTADDPSGSPGCVFICDAVAVISN